MSRLAGISAIAGTVVSTILLSPPGAAAQDAPTGAPEDPIQAVFDSAWTALGVPGASAAIRFADGTHWEGVGGIAVPGFPVTPRTPFDLGSVTKTYTAAVVLLLAGEGALSLDDVLATWFPEIPGADEITVAQLLNHTHGLHDPLQDPDYVPSILADPGREWTLEDVLSRMGDPVAAPGTAWHYSNTGYHLAGGIVEAITGAPLASAIESRLLGPLALRDTAYGEDPATSHPLAAAYIDPTGAGGEPQPISLFIPWTAFRSSAGPAGAVIATAPDAARWLHALAGGEVLARADWDRMTTWVDRPDGERHGLGLLRLEREDGPLLGHKGNAAGSSAALFHEPETGRTVAVLTNGHAVDVTPVVLALLDAAPGAPSR